MANTLLLIGFIIDIIGELMLAATVIMVHSKVSKEGKIDKSVVSEIHHEKKLAIFAILLILIGSSLQMSTMF